MKPVKENQDHLIVKAILIISVITITLSLLIYATKDSVSSGNLEVPEEMENFAEEETVEWMAGIWVGLTNGTLLTDRNTTEIDEYICADNSLRAEMRVQNGLGRPQPYYIMVLADGIPTQFFINRECFLTYPLSLTDKQEKLKLEIFPHFSQNLGRLDFLLFYNGNTKSDFHMTTYTIFVQQNGNIGKPSETYKSVEQRIGVRDAFRDGAYGAWLWNGSNLPAATEHIGLREINMQKNEDLLFEAIASEPGTYRTILIMDDHPTAFSVGGIYGIAIDWISHGTDMLQIPVELHEVPANPTSFFSISTPIGEGMNTLPCLASAKILVNGDAVGTEE